MATITENPQEATGLGIQAQAAAIAYFSARLAHETDPWDVNEMLKTGEPFTLVDARTAEAHLAARIPGSLSLPYRDMDEASTSTINRDHLVVVYCWGPACNAGVKGALRLAQLGFTVREMIGGFEYWVHEGFAVEGERADDPPIYGLPSELGSHRSSP